MLDSRDKHGSIIGDSELVPNGVPDAKFEAFPNRLFNLAGYIDEFADQSKFTPILSASLLSSLNATPDTSRDSVTNPI